MRIPNKYEVIYLSFALDSALKILFLNFRIHIGILLSLFLFLLEISKGISKVPLFLKKNWSMIPFIVYLFLNILLSTLYPGTAVIFLYYIIALTVYYFFFLNYKKISDQSVIYFQWIMIFTGLFQFILYKIFNYQLAFFEPEHYAVNAGFAKRLRGFFLEPNWYSIIFSLNILLLLNRIGSKIFLPKNYPLIIFSLLCFVLNGSYTFFVAVIFVVFFNFLSNICKLKIRKAVLLFLIISTTLFSISMITRSFFFKEKSSSTASLALNYGSRLIPAVKTIEFMGSQSIERQLLGFGLGSWPYIGLLENKLGYIGFWKKRKIGPTERDSAEFQVFLLELGCVGLLLFLFDYFAQAIVYGKKSIFYRIASVYLILCFFIYPIYKFLMYLIPYYILRAEILNRSSHEKKSDYTALR